MEKETGDIEGNGLQCIRTSHNPPAPEFLDLCDQMGFLVMDEAFDEWLKQKARYNSDTINILQNVHSLTWFQ